MNQYVCMTCHKPSYSASLLKDLYFPLCCDINCNGELREADTSGLELAVLITEENNHESKIEVRTKLRIPESKH